MNLLASVLVVPVVLFAAPGLASLALPPGYEEEMYCPPSTCSIVTWTHVPNGYVGGRGLWNFCYDPATDATTAAMFGGSLTKDDDALPSGWAKPPPCTAAQYSECEADAECGRKEVSPRGASCQCYVTSQRHPFALPYVPHHKAHCDEDGCDDLVPRCVSGADADAPNAGGTCELARPSTPSPSASHFPNPNTDNSVGGMCVYDEDCVVEQRSTGPLKKYRTGPKMCACYATSSQWGFDEREGKGTVVQVKCSAKCGRAGAGAVCDIEPDNNGFGECVLASSVEVM